MNDYARRDRAAAAGCCGLITILIGMSLGGGFGALMWSAPAIAAWVRAL